MKKRAKELLTSAKRDDARAEALMLRAAGLSGDESRDRKNSLVLEARALRSQASRTRKLAESVVTGHVATTARRKVKRS